MADLTQSKPRKYQGPSRGKIRYPAAANLRVFAGAALIEGGSGTAVNAVAGGGGFLGFATETVDNRTGSVLGGTANSTTVECEAAGLVWLTVGKATDWAATDIGATVYASDGDTFTLTVGTNIPIGQVAMILWPSSFTGVTSLEVLVAFEAAALRSL